MRVITVTMRYTADISAAFAGVARRDKHRLKPWVPTRKAHEARHPGRGSAPTALMYQNVASPHCPSNTTCRLVNLRLQRSAGADGVNMLRKGLMDP